MRQPQPCVNCYGSGSLYTGMVNWKPLPFIVDWLKKEISNPTEASSNFNNLEKMLEEVPKETIDCHECEGIGFA